MKRILYFKKSLKNLLSFIMICFLLASLNSLNAQSAIMEVSNFAAEHNLIRPIDRERILIYNYGNQFPAVGTIYTVSHSTYYYWLYLNQNIYIEDFEIIDNKHAYFCGSRLSGQSSSAILVYINVANFDENTVSLDLTYFMFTPSNLGYEITNFSKIEAFDVSDGTHVVLIGEAKDANGNVVSCIVDAYGHELYENQLTQWTYSAMYGVYYDEKFNDITVTDSFVVSVSSQDYTRNLFVRLYDRPTSISDNIFSTTRYETVDYMRYLTPYSNVLLRNNERNYFTLAYYANYENSWGLAVHSFDGNSVYAEGFLRLNYNQNNDIVIRDICYNKYHQTTDILCDSIDFYDPFAQTPYKYSSLVHIYPTGSAFSADIHLFDTSYHFYSNCVWPPNLTYTNLSMAVGKKSNIMEFYYGDLNTVGNCTEKYRSTAKEFHLSEKKSVVEQPIGSGGAQPDRYNIYPAQTPMVDICN